MIEEALKNAPDSIVSIYGTESLTSPVPASISFQEIEEHELGQISALKHPQKQIAVCNYLKISNEVPDFYIALDTIQDPGNLGTILRLASWFGIEHIIVSKETVNIYNPKVVQASMGAVFNVNVEYLDLEIIFKTTDLPIYGALLEGENIYATEKERKGILVMGNEGNGISEELLPYITHPINIPRFGKGESLNVAMATAIFLSEFSRP